MIQRLITSCARWNNYSRVLIVLSEIARSRTLHYTHWSSLLLIHSLSLESTPIQLARRFTRINPTEVEQYRDHVFLLAPV